MQRASLLRCSVVFFTCLAFQAPAFAASPCEDLLPADRVTAVNGAVTPEILAAMRDIGPLHTFEAERPALSLSPDKRSVAFEIHRADPATNRYCVALIILPLEKGAKPFLVDLGGDLIVDARPAKGWATFESGASMPISARWDPAGHWLAFLKRVNGSTQVWRAAVATQHAQQITHSPTDIEDFRLTADGTGLVYAARPGVAQNEMAIEREGLSGWRYDARWLPARAARPRTPDASTAYTYLDLATGAERPASGSQAALFASPAAVPMNAIASASALGGNLAWISPTAASEYPPRYELTVQTPAGRQVCSPALCKPGTFARLWWTDDGSKVRFTRSEGWANSQTAIYEWAPGTKAPRRLLATSDNLYECQPKGDELLCLRERSQVPRHLVLLGLDGRREQVLFQTNPEFASLALGRVERQEWRNPKGIPFFGDLVYPVNFKPGHRFPMVVVQYRTRGFLRGGVGDEMPIQAFANRGYFVLVFDIGNDAAMVGPQKSRADEALAYYRDLDGVKQVVSGLETITQTLIAKGLIDRERIGLQGLSAGTRTVQYAAIHSTLFSAGSLAGCCWEPDQDGLLGPTIASSYHKIGWPRIADPAPEFWSKISLMAQPRRVRFPILIQAPDSEYLPALGSITAMTQVGIPADLFVFPNEYHVKWHPAHRLATYRRNLAWFEFWLKGRVPEDPTGRAEAGRWAEMREEWRAVQAKSPERSRASLTQAP